ncbi:hypothetical protein V1290_004336 [Bradyrhizobium sp. AZCC 1578]
MYYALSIDVGSADVHGARTILGEDGLVAASADIERRSKVAMAPVTMPMMSMMTVAVMTMAMMTVAVMTMAMMTVAVAMMATMLSAGGRRCDRSRGHGNGGDGSEGNLTKHFCSPLQA